MQQPTATTTVPLSTSFRHMVHRMHGRSGASNGGMTTAVDGGMHAMPTVEEPNIMQQEHQLYGGGASDGHSRSKSKGCSTTVVVMAVALGILTCLLLAIIIFPLFWTIRLSFTNCKANRNRPVEWIGTRNYERILTDSDIWLNMQATAHFLFWTIFFWTSCFRRIVLDELL